MEWLLIIGALWFGGWSWSKYTDYRDKRHRQAARMQHNKEGVDAYNRLLAKAEPVTRPKLNIKQADISKLRLSDEQSKIFNLIETTNDNHYITGKAGTGKSVLLQYFVENSGKRVVVVAPTGVAALNVGGQTIHSFFGMPLHDIDPNDPEILKIGYRLREILRNIDTVVIDEISMVRVDLMEAVSRKLQTARNNQEPFGGVQMVFFGDLYQLPPVVTDGQLDRYFKHTYGGYYFFNAPAIQNTGLKIYELGHIFRQKDDSVFKEVLNALRHGKINETQLQTLNTRTGAAKPEAGYITLTGHNATVTAINQKRLNQLAGVQKTYKAEISGDITQGYYPTEKELKLKVGAQVMMLRNDTEHPRRWVNGTLGIITRLSEDVVRVNIDGVEHTVTPTTWSKIRYNYDHEERKLTKEIVSTFTQLPLRLAWAITIHKSQGQTYQSVAVDLSDGAFAHGQTYVALSRCVSLKGLYLDAPIKRDDVIVDPDIIEFMKKAVIAN